jgi:hypothetical protein
MPDSRPIAAAALEPIRNVVSASFLYPFKGIYYFLSHREYWPLFGRQLIPLSVISLVILGLLFAFTYVPQALFLLIFHGPTAWFNAVFLVLGEGQILVALLFEAFMVDETLVNVFDVCLLVSLLFLAGCPPRLLHGLTYLHQATLIREGLVDLVSPTRILFHDAPNAVKMLGKPTTSAVYSPFSFRQIAEFILFLPLNLIPVIGTPFFLLLTGARAGPLHHWRYFKLLGLSKKQRKEAIRRRGWKYTWYVIARAGMRREMLTVFCRFGTVALLLQLVPVLSMFFLLTTACGSALWAVKLEEQKKLIAEAPVPAPAAATDEENPPPPYTDDPI